MLFFRLFVLPVVLTNPASFWGAFTGLVIENQNISADKLELRVKYATVAHKILLFNERKRTQHEFHRKTQFN